MVDQQTALDIATEFINAIQEKGIHLRKAILFGSFSRNEQHSWSDIDLALVADEFIGVGFFDTKLFADVKVSDTKFTPIETHTFPSDYFEEGDPFIDEIKRTGIDLLLVRPELTSK